MLILFWSSFNDVRRQSAKIHLNSLDPICLNGTLIPFSDMVKNLGVIMDQSQSGDSWVKQIF